MRKEAGHGVKTVRISGYTEIEIESALGEVMDDCEQSTTPEADNRSVGSWDKYFPFHFPKTQVPRNNQ